MDSLARLYRSQLPFVTPGNVYFVDYGNKHASCDIPKDIVFTTVGAAYNSVVAGQGDTIILLDDGSTAGMDRETATIAWNKNDTHLVGPKYNVMGAGRASLRALAGSNFTPLIKITGAGCSFWNIGSFHGYDSAVAQIAWHVNGSRNKFINCGLQGLGHATAGAQTGGASLYLDAASENEFRNCTIGLTTIAQSVANQQILINNVSDRNRFIDCMLETYATAATHCFIRGNTSGGSDRYLEFLRCIFMNPVNSAATAMTAVSAWHATEGGTLLFPSCDKVGSTGWGPAQSNIYAPSTNGLLAALA